MKFLKNIVPLLFLLTILLFSCEDDNPVIPPTPPPPVLKDTLTLSITDVTHRSVSIKIQTTNNNTGKQIQLFRKAESEPTFLPVTDYPATVLDTTIIDYNENDGLELDTEYNYYAVRIDSLGMPKDSSSVVSGRTLAATSHEYEWQEIVLGEFQSALYDVWGTDENNVYAVGSVILDGEFYGVLHYNGVEWKGIKEAGGSAIYGFSENDIWVAGGGVFHFDGNTWKQVDSKTVDNRSVPLDSVLFNNGSYTSIWGTSSNDLYFASSKGRIIHWDGTSASVVYNGGARTFNDVDGISNELIIAVGTQSIHPSSTIFYNGYRWTEMEGIDNAFSIRTVAIVNSKEIYFGGDGVFRKTNNNFERIYSPGYSTYKIEYNKVTGELISVGPFDGIYIYNGLDWNNLRLTASNDGSTYIGLHTDNNSIICVGRVNNSAKILVGTRQ